MKKMSISLIIFILFGQLFAQSGSITGRILDEENNDPLIGANVIVVGTTMGAATDLNGNYLIQNVPVGAVSLNVSYIGYEEKSIDLTVTLGEIVTANIALAPEAIQMQTYVVTASRRRERVEDAPAAISVITQKEIRRESNTNLGDYLKQVKGVDFTQSGVDSYNLCGRLYGPTRKKYSRAFLCGAKRV